MFNTPLRKKRLIGILLFAVILVLFFSFNRFPKLDAVGGDLDAVTSPGVQCFQGFCIDSESGSSFLSQWWGFSVTYLRLVTVGMTFAFLVAGLAEAFLYPSGSGRWFSSGSVFKRTVKGLAVGPVMNLCSACIVPVSSAFYRRGAGLAGAIAMVQGSATMNIPALAMVFFVFTPILGLSRLILALIGALLIGPIVVMAVRKGGRGPVEEPEEPELSELPVAPQDASWAPVLTEAFRDWAKSSVGYLVRMGPIMIIAGFASGLAIQWLSPETVSNYLGNDLLGVVIAATFGILINVPLLFEIPLVALLLLMGMGTAPAAALLFTAAAGGPVTFWGLAKLMPRRAIATFATATWAVGAFGGVAVLGLGALIWESGPSVKIGGNEDVPPFDSFLKPTTLDNGFTNVTDTAGVGFLHHGVRSFFANNGAAPVVFDFNNDGFHDIYVTDTVGPNALYRNNGDGTFTDVSKTAGVDDATISYGGCAADYDNNGDQDLYVTNFGTSKLFHNNGGGTFADVTAASGTGDASPTYRSTGCAWGDYDSDGFLDLIIVRHFFRLSPNLLEQREEIYDSVRPLVLYHNNGDGTFTDVTRILGDTSGPSQETLGPVGNVWGAGFQPGWLDYDNDGDPDLYIVNDWGGRFQPNVLWRNDGPSPEGAWTFLDVSATSGADVPMDGMGLAVGDYDLDGFLDLYMTNIGDNVLLRNNGDGLTFANTALEAGVAIGGLWDEKRVTWGAMFFDYDNDGDEDLYVVTGFLQADDVRVPEPQPNVLLRNNRDGTFTDVSSASGADEPIMGRGGAFLDLNNDGCLDLFVGNFGERATLFQNLCDSNGRWLVINTVGTTSNRDGIGARITLLTDGDLQIREISAGRSNMGQNMREAHFGLGSADTVDSITVRWPSGKTQTLTNVPANQRLTITEPQ